MLLFRLVSGEPGRRWEEWNRVRSCPGYIPAGELWSGYCPWPLLSPVVQSSLSTMSPDFKNLSFPSPLLPCSSLGHQICSILFWFSHALVPLHGSFWVSDMPMHWEYSEKPLPFPRRPQTMRICYLADLIFHHSPISFLHCRHPGLPVALVPQHRSAPGPPCCLDWYPPTWPMGHYRSSLRSLLKCPLNCEAFPSHFE